jgi:hypothetical protein
VQSGMHNNVFAHVQHFRGLQVCFSKINGCFQAIWLATIWLIWRARNDCCFNNNVFAADFVVFQIKIHVWWWFKVKFKDFYCAFASWFSNPLLCLGRRVL